MRLGTYPCKLAEGRKAHQAYKAGQVNERQRHRYEFNNQFRQQFAANGLEVTGTSPNGQLVEIVELRDHPWFLAVQCHPEFKSKPTKAHPLFRGFIKAALQKREKKTEPARSRALTAVVATL